MTNKPTNIAMTPDEAWEALLEVMRHAHTEDDARAMVRRHRPRIEAAIHAESGLDEERLARALGVVGHAEGLHRWCKDVDGCGLYADGREFAADLLAVLTHGGRPMTDSKRVTRQDFRDALDGMWGLDGLHVADDIFDGFDALPDPPPSADVDAAYRERNAVVAALIRSHGWPAEVVMAPDTEGWWIVYAETPQGQVSWHIAPDDMDLFSDWPVAFGTRPSPWDGHTTEEKYRRLAAIRAESEAKVAAPRAAGEGYDVRVWQRHEPSGVVVLVGHPQLGGRYCLTDGGDWPCSVVRAALALPAVPPASDNVDAAWEALRDDVTGMGNLDALSEHRPLIEAAIRADCVSEAEEVKRRQDAIAAIRAESGLDVERLRRASDNVREMDPLAYLDEGDEIDAIAAEYARLTEADR